MGRKKKNPVDPQAERCKRGAAGQADTTKGRSRVFKDQTIYDRKREKSDEDN